MTTRMRTWILLAGLSALFVAVGGLVGGTSGIALFLVIAVGFNFAMFWFSDRLALKLSRAHGRSRRASSPISSPTSRISRNEPGFRCRGCT